MKITKNIFLISLIGMYSLCSFGTGYFVSKTGTDSNDGLSWGNSCLTIQKALEQAVSGDEIWVAAGTYQEEATLTVPENISLYGGFSGNETSLDQQNLKRYHTVLDGSESHRCVTNSGKIQGFDITKGKAYEKGGAVYNSGVISQCRIYKNQAYIYGSGTAEGGGVYNESGTVLNCLVYDNTCDAIPQTSPGFLVGEEIGSGIYNALDGTVEFCTVVSNNSEYNCVAVYNDGILKNSIIWDDYSIKEGFSGNSQISYCCYNGAELTNGNISIEPSFMNTQGPNSAWVLGLKDNSSAIDSGSATSYEIDYYGNIRTAGIAPDMGAIEYQTELSSQFHVDNYTPRRDENVQFYDDSYGNATSWAWDFDNDGIVDSTEQNPVYAYYSSGTYSVSLTVSDGTNSDSMLLEDMMIVANRYYVKQDGDDANTGDSWGNARKTMNSGIGLCEENDELWVAEGIYHNSTPTPMHFNRKLYVFGGFNGTESQLSERKIITNKTVIDGQNQVTCVAYLYKGASLDGFFITGGISSSSHYAGGVTGDESTCLKNCVIYNNRSMGKEGRASAIYGGKVENCVVYGNMSLNSSCAVYQGNLINCTIASNQVDSETSAVAGSTVTNSICWNDGMTDISDSTVSNSCFKESQGENGNIILDPLFTISSEKSGVMDYMLQSNSPCIDAAVSITEIPEDIQGVERPQGNNPDMGAFEVNDSLRALFYYSKEAGVEGKTVQFTDASYGSPDSWSWDFDSDGTPDSTLQNPMYTYSIPGEYSVTLIVAKGQEQDSYTRSEKIVIAGRYFVKTEGSGQMNGESWENAFGSITYGLNTSVYGSEIWVAAGTYKEGACITIPENVTLYGGFSGAESALDERDIENNITFISGERRHGCIYNDKGIIDGFDIAEGYGEKGAGIYNSLGIVKNCRVFDNRAEGSGAGIANMFGTVLKCRVFENISKLYGGGIYCYYGKIQQCYIYSNNCYRDGGGVFLRGSMENSLLYDNTANYNNSNAVHNYGTVSYCTIANNRSASIDGNDGIYIHSIAWDTDPRDYNGFLNLDPKFINDQGDISSWDFHLKAGSPYINNGATENIPSVDLDGNPRPGADGITCMGAFEFTGQTPVPSNFWTCYQ